MGWYRTTVAVALVTVCLGADKPGEDKAAADRKALTGAWDAVGGEAMGRAVAKADLPLRWTFAADGTATLVNRTTKDESPFTLTFDPAQSPKTIDLAYTGSQEGLKGAKQYGVYKVEGDTLTLCLSPPGSAAADRPTGFETKGTRAMLVRFERAAKK